MRSYPEPKRDGGPVTTGSTLVAGSYSNQALEWDGSSWSGHGFYDDFPGAGDETALNARWTPDTPDTGAGESVVVGGNSLTISTATAGSGYVITGPSTDSVPIDIRYHLDLTNFLSTNDRVDVELGGSYSTGIVMRYMIFSGALQAFSVKKGASFNQTNLGLTALWLRILVSSDGGVSTWYSSASHSAEPKSLGAWTQLGASTIEGVAGDPLVIKVVGSAQVTATIRNFSVTRPR